MATPQARDAYPMRPRVDGLMVRALREAFDAGMCAGIHYVAGAIPDQETAAFVRSLDAPIRSDFAP